MTFQYVNPAYERIFGYTREELIGKEEKSMPELHESTASHLLKGRKWEGTVSCRRKGGDNISHYCQIVPITGQNGKIRHLVSLKTPLGTLQGTDKNTTANDGWSPNKPAFRRGSIDLRSNSSTVSYECPQCGLSVFSVVWESSVWSECLQCGPSVIIVV
ncbi:High affinity cAMP-specific and IBMX-insensitive 3',5'-cyclic phosphodiesterase 8B [Lamellibrachia satsuma]|nr:High affinity cAMP-specific and IBMX-insensitive 3',5'-cyclic phosphodiesterase 8B [Lamellibrachia satsuma]